MPGAARFDTPPARRILPDYAFPDALCVPLWEFDIKDTLASIATAAAHEVGVIVMGPDEAVARAFIDRQPQPDHFGFVAAAYDTPWLRDHAPIFLTDDDDLTACLPRRPGGDRERDHALFATLLKRPPETTGVQIAAGNLVPGPAGLAVSTTDLLDENGVTDPADLAASAQQLGIVTWLFVPRFPDDLSGHTDTMVRFLGPTLAAIAARSDGPEAAAVTATLRDLLTEALPRLDILDIPCAAQDGTFNSPLNWIQLGQTLLAPDFSDGSPPVAETLQPLAERGYHVVPVPAETGGLGGALHCLTAGVFVDEV